MTGPSSYLGQAGEINQMTAKSAIQVRELAAPACSDASSPIAAIWKLAARVAPSDLSVLILGETGVGKEVMAQTLRGLSRRASHPMVSFNCAGLAPALVESELFGHEGGAFTGATHARSGLLEAADGGTVYLDELGELTLSMQAKLLRVVESREILPVGGVKVRRIDVRFIGATNRDLERDVADGRFRRDLLVRLDGITITIPPLRERRSEIMPLANRFIAEETRLSERLCPPTLGRQAIERLEAHSWPGNIRELKNVIARAVVLCDGDVIDDSCIWLDRAPRTAAPLADALRSLTAEERVPRPATNTLAGRQRIALALAAAAGNQIRAARSLGVPRRTFVVWLDRFEIPRPRKRALPPIIAEPRLLSTAQADQLARPAPPDRAAVAEAAPEAAW
jgi:two-component system, NtrC family, response regulator AtoC